MATLTANGKAIAEMTLSYRMTDGADADEMSQAVVKTYRAMTSGKILVKTVITSDYGIGGKPGKTVIPWKVNGRVKPQLMTDNQAFRDAWHAWQEQLAGRGHDAEVTYCEGPL
jgi:hypothetical protein